MEGPGAQSGDLTVGVNQGGSLTIQNGGVLGSGLSIIGQNPGSNGTVTVTGSGSKWINSALIVGDTGTGLLFVTGGGTLVTEGTSSTGLGTALIGGFLGGDAVATVDGVGSTWTNAGPLSIGVFSSGTLLVGNGAAVSSDLIQVGAFAGPGALVISTGATVSTGAMIIDHGTLTIGGATAIPVAPGTLTTSLDGVSFGPGGGTVVFNHTSNNYVFGSPITGDGSVIVENGTTILTGANTYTVDTESS